MADTSKPVPRSEAWWCRGLAAVLILGAAAGHIAYLAWDGSVDLSPDEAHYWVWSQHLDWSYYSKGPLIAYLIRAGTEVVGGLSLRWTGDLMLAVRLPAVICGSLLLTALYILTIQVYRRERLALAVVALALTLPPIAIGASLITIDAPYTCLWAWAMVAGHRAYFRGSAWAWPLAGILVALGILAKYTMVVWLPSLAIFLWFEPQGRALLRRPGVWVMGAIAALGCMPILVWNIQNDWVTFQHVSTLAGVQGATGMKWLGPLHYVGTQIGVLMVYWFAIWAAAMVAHRPWKENDGGVRYLWWMSAPMFTLFFAFSIRTNGGEANWPITAYLSGLLLAADWLARRLRTSSSFGRIAWGSSIAVAASVGMLLIGLLHFGRLAQPFFLALSGPVCAKHPVPLRRFDPTARIRGWRHLAAEVDQIRQTVRTEEGAEPVLAGERWNIPGELSFYCEGHPASYTLGAALGDRYSQLDLWHPSPVWDASAFEGKTFIFVGMPTDALKAAFPGGITRRVVEYRENGHLVCAWSVVVARGFTSLPLPKTNKR